jgi:HEAT repeat protein
MEEGIQTGIGRDIRRLVFWSAAIVFLLLVVGVSTAIVVQVLQVRRAIADVPLKYQVNDQGCAMAVKALGGPSAAARKLATYIRMPQWMAPSKKTATFFLAATGEPGVPAMLQCLDHSSAEVREAAFTMMVRGHPAAKRAIPKFIALAGASHDTTAWAAILALGTVGPEAKEAVPTLIDCLRHQDPKCRQFAAKALGQIGDRRAVGPLKATATDPEDRVKAAAEEALLKLTAPQSEQP